MSPVTCWWRCLSPGSDLRQPQGARQHLIALCCVVCRRASWRLVRFPHRHHKFEAHVVLMAFPLGAGWVGAPISDASTTMSQVAGSWDGVVTSPASIETMMHRPSDNPANERGRHWFPETSLNSPKHPPRPSSSPLHEAMSLSPSDSRHQQSRTAKGLRLESWSKLRN